jgi:fructoselysine-6-P-deglycase FrlB-like protein
MTGFDKAKAAANVAMENGVVSVVVVAVGTQDAPEKLAGPLLEREIAKRERLPLETIVVKGLPA